MKKQIERISRLQEQIIFLLGVNEVSNFTKWLMPQSMRGDFGKAKTVRPSKDDFQKFCSINKKQLVKMIREEVFYNSNLINAGPTISRSLDNLEEKKYISMQDIIVSKKKEKEVTITTKGMKLYLKVWLEVKPFATIYQRMMNTFGHYEPQPFDVNTWEKVK